MEYPTAEYRCCAFRFWTHNSFSRTGFDLDPGQSCALHPKLRRTRRGDYSHRREVPRNSGFARVVEIRLKSDRLAIYPPSSSNLSSGNGSDKCFRRKRRANPATRFVCGTEKRWNIPLQTRTVISRPVRRNDARICIRLFCADQRRPRQTPRCGSTRTVTSRLLASSPPTTEDGENAVPKSVAGCSSFRRFRLR